MAEETPSRELLENLVERIDRLERILQAQTARLYAVEQGLGFEPRPRTPAPVADDAGREGHAPGAAARPAHGRRAAGDDARAPQTPRDAGSPDAHTPGAGARPPEPRDTGRQQHGAERSGYAYESTPQAQAGARGGKPWPKPPPHGPATPHAQAQKRDVESIVGGRVFQWVGIIAAVFGVGLFLKLAFDSEWIGPRMRVSIGALVGLALLAVGERLRWRGLRAYAFVMSGGGVLILYLSIYASYDFYQLLGQPAAFLLMALVTTVAVLLSVRHDALAVAVLGLVGGFLTPALISSGRDNEVALFTYVALLDAGVLAVAYFKRWRSLDFLSFACTVLMSLGWAAKFYDSEKLWTTLFFVSVFFVLYSLLAVFHNVLPRRRSRWFDVALLGWNATLYFGFGYLMLSDAGYERAAPAAHALALAAYFAALFFFARARCPEDRLLAYGYAGAAVTLFTAAVAIQLELHWVTIVWAAEGLMLTWVGLKSGESSARRYAYAVYALAALHWLAVDMQTSPLVPDGDFTPLFNLRAASCLALIAALEGGAWLYGRARASAEPAEGGEFARGRLDEDERAASASALTLAAHGFAVTLLSLDLSEYFGRRKAGAAGLEAARAENARQFALTALWSVYGAGLVAYGARRAFRAVRYAGFALLALVTVKVFAYDLSFYAAVWHVPVLNQTFLAFAFVVAAYAFAARLYARAPGLEEERPAIPVLVVVANVLMLVALSAEAAGYFDSGRAGASDAARARDLELAKQLSLSVIWALYGAGLLVAGGLWRVKLLRVLALALLSLTTLKVFFWDLSSLDRAYRIVSFIVLGAILLAVSYLYQKSQQRAAAGEWDATRLDADAAPFDADAGEEAR
ncbi:MAG TPA: DUF2339 domain-containing protein [Pyrinomonadaceae bacterium]|nr:DUF2339 domain-containing protein [Pyrinomonadaceae bacterium]